MKTTEAELIPPTSEIRERLASVATEGRLLRKLLKLASDRDKATTRPLKNQEVANA